MPTRFFDERKALGVGTLRRLLAPSTPVNVVHDVMQRIALVQAGSSVNNIIAQLERDEGLVLTTYIDTTGNETIGYGHNLTANPISGVGSNSTITSGQALSILLSDITVTYQGLVKAAPWVALFNPSQDQVTRRGVLLNMAFNLGVAGLLSFKNTLAAVQNHDYVAAATGMAGSLWASQVGVRATRLEEQMRTGIWQ